MNAPSLMPFECSDAFSCPPWMPTDMEISAYLHHQIGFQSFRLKLFRQLGSLLPPEGPLRILDVGAGDGTMAEFFAWFRPETTCCGLETKTRHDPKISIEIREYAGDSLPFESDSFDVVLFSNVLHHTPHAEMLVAEACRVSRDLVLIKDHLYFSVLDWWKLLLLDYVGNLRFGVSVPALYLNLDAWCGIFEQIALREVHAYEAKFREGWMEKFFSNRLEVFFVLKVDEAMMS